MHKLQLSLWLDLSRNITLTYRVRNSIILTCWGVRILENNRTKYGFRSWSDTSFSKSRRRAGRGRGMPTLQPQRRWIGPDSGWQRMALSLPCLFLLELNVYTHTHLHSHTLKHAYRTHITHTHSHTHTYTYTHTHTRICNTRALRGVGKSGAEIINNIFMPRYLH